MACQGSRIVGDGSSFHSIVVTVKTSSMEIIKAIEEPLQPSINSALVRTCILGVVAIATLNNVVRLPKSLYCIFY